MERKLHRRQYCSLWSSLVLLLEWNIAGLSQLLLRLQEVTSKKKKKTTKNPNKQKTRRERNPAFLFIVLLANAVTVALWRRMYWFLGCDNLQDFILPLIESRAVIAGPWQRVRVLVLCVMDCRRENWWEGVDGESCERKTDIHECSVRFGNEVFIWFYVFIVRYLHAS